MAHGDMTDDGRLAIDIEIDAAVKRLRSAAISADAFLLRTAADDLRRSSDILEASTCTTGTSPRLSREVQGSGQRRSF